MDEFNNKKYITLKEAAKLFGYSPDYLGFLARKRKIKGKRTYLISWKTTTKEIVNYCKERKRKIKKPYFLKRKLTLKQASRLSKYTPDHLGQLLRTGKIKGKKVKTQISWLVDKEDVQRYREGREERQSNTRKPLRFSFIKIRRKQLVLIGRRLFASTFVLIYFISGIAPTDFLLASIGAFFIEEPETINLYSQLAEGDWQNPRRAQGPPDISLDKDISSFSESNSAVYQTGPLSLVLKDFDPQEDISSYLFNSAQIKISFAIGEKETDLSVIEEPEQETTTSTEEQISFWNKIKQFFNSLLTSIRSIVFKALSIAKAEEEQVQETQEPEQPDDPQESEEIEENPPVEEEGQSTIEEDEESPLDQDTWLDEIVEELEGEDTPAEEPPSEEQIPEQELLEDISLATSTEEVESVEEEQPEEEESTEIEPLPIEETTTTEKEATTTEQEFPPAEETATSSENVATSSDEVTATSSDGTTEELSPEPEPEPEIQPDPDTLPNLDAKIIIYWSLDNENWQVLDTISSYPLSNHLNNGYFTYNTPFLTDWQDINNLQIKFEGVIGGQTNIISYLDSVWITAEYEEQAEEETPAPDEEQQAPPVEEEQPTDEGGGGEEDEESLLDQDTWLDEIVEELEGEEQPVEETEEEPQEETEEPEETSAPSDEDGDEEQIEEEEQPSDDESTEGEAEEETEKPGELDEESEEDPEEQPEEEESEEEQKTTKKLRKIKIKDNSLIFKGLKKKDFTSNEEPFFTISTPDITIEELLNTDKAEEILEEDGELPEAEPMATSTIATSTDELATSTKEIEEEVEEEEEEEDVVEEESEEEIIEEETITTTTEPIIEQTTTTEATSTEEESFDEDQDEQPSEETEEELIEEEVEEETPAEELEEELTEEQPEEQPEEEPEEIEEPEQPEEQLEEENEELTLLEKIKIFFKNIILALKQGIQKIVSIIIKIVRQNIPSVKAQSANNLKLTIIQPDGKESPLTPQITTTYINGKEVFEVKLQKPKTGLQPGLYKLQIEIETSEAIFISEQEFTWGVLAINVNKSIYVPTEQAYVQMAALNEWGHTLCEANLELRIKNNKLGINEVLSTEDGTIEYSGECHANNVVDVPDYYAYYQVKEAGKYEMTLKNLDTGYEIIDYFEAQNFIPFDVERIGPTRIWPWAPYQMILNIKANQDFEGQIVETVPQGFEIQIQDTNYKILETNEAEKQIIWDVGLTQGDELEVSYTFDAPDISPYLFLLGPLTFTTQQAGAVVGGAGEDADFTEVNSLATTTLATTTDLVEVGFLQAVIQEPEFLTTSTNATGSEVLEEPSEQNTTSSVGQQLELEKGIGEEETIVFQSSPQQRELTTGQVSFIFQELRKWQLASDAATLNQRAFIFRSDDGGSGYGGTDMGTVNTTTTNVKIGQRVIVRIQVDNTGDATSTAVYRLQYDKNDGAWVNIKGDAEIHSAKSLSGKNNERLPYSAVGDCYTGTTWTKGRFYEGRSRTKAFSLGPSKCTEFAFIIDTSSTTVNTTYRLRLIDLTASSTLNTYTYYPAFTTVDSSSDTLRHSKSLLQDAPLTLGQLKYMLDNEGYSNISADDGARDILNNVIMDVNADDTTSTYDVYSEYPNSDNARFGTSVSLTGDINGDGYKDLIVGAPESDIKCSGCGAAFIYYGSPGMTVTSTYDVYLEYGGSDTNARFGQSVSSAGDVNGDGYDDIVVGAHLSDMEFSDAGAAFIYYGSSTMAVTSTYDVFLQYPRGGDQIRFGFSVSSAGDVDADGYDDVVVGAYNGDYKCTFLAIGCGEAYIYYGSSTMAVTSTYDVYLEYPGSDWGAWFGSSVSGGGDVNGDGYDDVVVGGGPSDYKCSNCGAAFIYYGSSTMPVTATHDVYLESPENSAGNFGDAVSLTADINGDGYDDVLVGAYLSDLNGTSDAGAAFIYYGSSTMPTTATYDVYLEYPASDEDAYFGDSVATEDINNDGYADAIIGAGSAGPTEGPVGGSDIKCDACGAAFIYYGSSVMAVTSTYDVYLEYPGSDTTTTFGVSISPGDVNGDGYKDIAVGSYFSDISGNTDAGAAFIFYSGTNIVTPTSTDDRYFEYPYDYSSVTFGSSISSAGDVNGDGYDDLIVGASDHYDATYGANTGGAFIYYGSSYLAATATYDVYLRYPYSTVDDFGYSAAGVGDVNGDGYDDVGVGAPDNDKEGSNWGAVFIYYGSSTMATTSAYDVYLQSPTSGKFGNLVAAAGDFNGDGYDDIIASANQSGLKCTLCGAAFIYHGSSTMAVTSTYDVYLEYQGTDLLALFGNHSVAAAGDVNGDGYDDAIVGASQSDHKCSDCGAAYIYYGTTTTGTLSYDVYLEYPATDAGWLGNSVSSAGDVNGDSYDDVLVGAQSSDINVSGGGAAFIYYGGLSMDSNYDIYFEYPGTDAGSFGNWVDARDVNNDGYPDFLITAYQSDIKDTDIGGAWLFFGSPAMPTTSTFDVYFEYPYSDTSAEFGSRGCLAGDLNGDGYEDVVVSARYSDVKNTDAGGVWAFMGGKSISYPTFYFATKLSNTSQINASWNGQSSIAASIHNIKLDVYNFNTSSWENKVTNTTCVTSTDCTMSDSITSDVSYYYDSGNWTYWRVYQEKGNPNSILKTDEFINGESTLAQRAYIFENDNGSDVNSNSNMSAANTTTTDLKKGQRFVARFQLDNTSSVPATTTYKLQYDKQDSQWIDVDYGGAPNINSGASSSDWNATTVDSGGSVGQYTSIAIGTDGNPVISYYDTTNDNLNFLKCGNPSCTSGNTTTSVDSSITATTYQRTSIAIGTDGLPVISYYDNTLDNLNFAKCTTTDCTQKSDWATTTVDEVGDVGLFSSIAIGTDGYPVISYYASSTWSLCFAKCNTGNCTQKSNWSTTTVDSGAESDYYPSINNSIAIGTDGYPVISYFSEIGDNLVVAKCTTNNCTQKSDWTTTTVDKIGQVGWDSSIAIGTDGNPVVSYYDLTNGDLKVAKCGNPSCSSGNTTTTVDTEGDVGLDTSIAIGTDGNPIIAYQDYSNKSLKVVKCRDSICSSASTTAPFSNISMTINDGSATNFGSYTSMAIGWDGWPVISYYDGDNNDLKVAKMRPLVEIQPAWGLSGTSSTPLTSNEAGDCAGGTNWTDGQWYEATTTSNAIPLDTNECTELAFVLDTVEATASTTYRLRLVKEDGTLLDSYSEYPALKIVKETQNTSRYSKEAIMTSGSGCDVSDWNCNTVTSLTSGSSYRNNSIAIGTDGNPVIAYWDNTNDDLLVAKCGNPSCTSGNTTSSIFATDEAGKYNSIAIGTDGNPVIAYWHRDFLSDVMLRVAKCGNPSCTSGNTNTTVDSVGNPAHNSIAIGTDGNPVIAYNDGSVSLKVLKCDNPSCSLSSSVTVDSSGSIGNYNSIAIGTDGNPVIAYYDAGADDLKVLKCDNPSCSSSSYVTVDATGDSGVSPSIAIGTDGYPVIVYTNYIGTKDLIVTKCGNPSCSSGNTSTTVDATDFVGRYNSIAIGTDGNPVIAYYNETNDRLILLKCGNSSCSSGNASTTIESSIGSYPDCSMAIGTDGYPVISYIHTNSEILKIAKQLGLPKTAISYFNRYIKTDAQVKISRNMWSGTISEGPNNPVTIVNDDESHGSISWTTPEDADESDNQTANCILGAGNLSYYLKATDFGFSIPGGATINGIVVEAERHAAIGGGIYDGLINIVKNGNIGSENKKKADVWLSFGDTYYTYGSNTDLWSEEWTASDINDSAFGFALAAKCTSGAANVYVDHIRITVYYEIPALYLESSPAIEDGLQYKFDKADYSAAQTVGDSSFSNATSTGGTSTSTPMFVFTDKHSTNINPLYVQWKGQSTLAASDKNIVLQVYRFGNSTNTTGWVTTTVNTICTADTDCTLEYSTTTDLSDFFYPEYKFNDSTGTTSADYWTFWRVYQEEATGSLSPPTLKTDFWQIESESTLTQRAYIFENDDGSTVNGNSDMSAINTTTTDLKKGQRFIARFQLDNLGVAATNTFKLQYDKQDEQWIDIDYGGAPNINSGASSSDWNATSIDSVGDAIGPYTSIAIGTDGNPVVSYFTGPSDFDLKILKCGNPSCTSGNIISTVDDYIKESYTSIAIGTDGNPIVSYYDDLLGSGVLSVVKCNDPACSGGDEEVNTVDESDLGRGSSIAIGTDGLPVISYYDNLNDGLKFAKCGNASCSSGNTKIRLDSMGTLGLSPTSIAIGTDGLPVISYYDSNNDDLKFAKCTTTDCTSPSDWATTTVDTTGDVGENSSLAIGTDGLPVISYYDNTNDNLNFAKCTTTDCTDSADWTTTTLDTVGLVGRSTSIAIGTDGLPVISYRDITKDSLKIVKCKDASCSGATSSQVLITINDGSANNFGRYSSITISRDGWPVISYYDDDNNYLKVAKMRPLVEIQPAWGLSGSSGDALNATQAGGCLVGTSWTNGKWFEATTTVTIGIGANECTELAFVLDTVEATVSTTYRLRLVKEDGTLLDSYSEYPALKIVKESNNTLRYSKEAIMTSASSCAVDDWECTAVDSNLGSSANSSIVIGTDGNPVIVYFDETYTDLRILKCGNPSCTSGNTTTTIDETSSGKWAFITIGTDGNPVIAYFTSNNLLFAKCGNPSCTSGNTITTIDTGIGSDGGYASIAIGTDGNPVIAYYDDIVNDLLVAKCGNPSCTSGNTITTIDTEASVGRYTSIAIGTNGNPVIAYMRDLGGPYDYDLIFAKCGNPSCTSGNATTTVDSVGNVGRYNSIAIGVDGSPVISYFDDTLDNLNFARCTTTDCTNSTDWATTTVDSIGVVGSFSSLAIGTDGNPMIAYYQAGGLNNLKVAKCGNPSCSLGNTTTIIDVVGIVGQWSSLAISVDGYPVIGYYDDSNGNLKVAKQLGLPKTAISYFNRYIKTDGQIKLTRNQWTTATTGAMWLEASPAIEDGLQYKFDKADYTSSQISGDSSFTNVTSTGGTSTSTPMFVFTDRHTTNTTNIYVEWKGQSTLGADSKNIVLQVFRFGNSSNTTGWVTTTEETTCIADTDCTIESSTTTDLTDFYFPEYRFNDSTGTTTAYYWTFWRIYQKEATGSQTPSTLKTDSWGIQDEPYSAGFIKQYHIRWRNDDGGE